MGVGRVRTVRIGPTVSRHTPGGGPPLALGRSRPTMTTAQHNSAHTHFTNYSAIFSGNPEPTRTFALTRGSKFLPPELLFETVHFITVERAIPNAFPSCRMLHFFLLARVVKWKKVCFSRAHEIFRAVRYLILISNSMLYAVIYGVGGC